VRSDPNISIDNDEIEAAFGKSFGAFQEAVRKLK
jgi:hypothetical protein